MGQKAGIAEREVFIKAAGGIELPAFVAEPAGADGAPRIVIAPEVFGVSPWIREVARRLAREGFRAVAPEIFARDDRPVGNDIMARIGRLDIPQAVSDLRLALESLGDGKSASIGFCLGGALSLLTAAVGGLSACVDCYGRPRWRQQTTAPHPIDAVRRVRCPVLAVYGKRDPGIPVADAEELGAVLPPGSELALYDAGHAFLNDTRPDMYVERASTLAWPRITGFLHRTLS